MANHIAYYDVLADNNVLNLPNFDQEQDVGGTAADEALNNQLLVWKPAGDIQLDGPGNIRPVLCYNVDLDNADDFRLRVKIRGAQGDKTISTFTYGGNTTRQWMDPFQLEWVRKDSNVFIFEKMSGDGAVQIRNVIVMYQRLINS